MIQKADLVDCFCKKAEKLFGSIEGEAGADAYSDYNFINFLCFLEFLVICMKLSSIRRLWLDLL